MSTPDNQGMAESVTTLANKYAINDAMGEYFRRRRESSELGHTQEIATIMAAELLESHGITPVFEEPGESNE